MAFNLQFMDLKIIIKAYGYDEETATIVADYLDELDYDVDLSYYIWNTLPFNVEVFKTRKEAEEYVKDNLCCDIEDCTIYVSNNGTYLEWN
jgi:hypothetical protein